jgi:AAT family amino acid transporter
MLYTLGVNGQAPKIFTKLSRNGVPLLGTIGVLVGLGIGVILSYISPENLFVHVYSASVLPGMVPWFVILISQINFRKIKGDALQHHPFKMPFAPVTNYVTIAFLLMVLVGMWMNDETRISLISGIIFLGMVVMSYYAFGVDKATPIRDQTHHENSNK